MIEFTQILSPVDFSESSTHSFAHAAALANWYEAQLTVVHVVPTFEPVPIRGQLGEPVCVDPPSREQVLEEIRRSLDLLSSSSVRVTTETSAHFNSPEYRRHMIADTQERFRGLVAEESRTWVEIEDVIVFGRAHEQQVHE